jgi:hypothetical protein
MIADDKTPAPVSPYKRRARLLRMISIIALVAGVAGTGIVYWLGTREPDASGDLSMAGYNKPEERQMAILYGKQGELIENWSDDLKQPGTQAILIIAFSTAIAAACFYFARLCDADDEAG